MNANDPTRHCPPHTLIYGVVSSAGVTNRGNSVVRIWVNGRQLEVSINVVGFADLASAGVRIVNEGGA